VAQAKGLQTVLFALLVGVLCSSVRADDSVEAAGPRSEARRLFLRGVEAATNGLWEEARGAFSRSFELVPNASTLLNLAGSQVNTGQLVEARDNYRRVLEADSVTSLGKEEIAKLIAALDARIPKLSMAGVGSLDAVLVDGTQIAGFDAALGLALNPGDHAVEIKRASELLLRHQVVLTESQEVVLDIAAMCSRCGAARTIAEDRSSAVAEAVETSTVSRQRAQRVAEASVVEERQSSAPSMASARVLPWLALGVGVTGALALAVAGPMALHEEQALSRGCGVTQTCSASDAARADRLARMADAGLAMAATGLVASALGFWLRPKAVERVARAQPQVSLTSVALTAKVPF